MESSRNFNETPRTVVHYFVIGPCEGRLCSTAQDRSRLCRGIIAATASSRPLTQETLIAYSVDDRWLRLVLSSSKRALDKAFIKRLLGIDQATTAASEPPHAMLVWVRSVELPSLVSQLAAVRHCHFAPVDLGLASEPAAWPWTTHRLYLGLEVISGFTRNWLADRLAQGHGGWQVAYSRLMSAPDYGETAVELSHCTVPILPIAQANGDRACLRALKRIRSHDEGREYERFERAFGSIVRRVCRTTGCDVRAFRSNPAAPRFRLERALLVDRLVVNGKLMSMTELSARLRCDRSWLYRTYHQCRREYPDLFEETAAAQHSKAPKAQESDPPIDVGGRKNGRL